MKTLEELKASPAPWRPCLCGIGDGNNRTIAELRVLPLTSKESEAANAALMAAAPDLYAALRDCMTKMCEYCRKEARHSLPGRTCERGCAVMLAAKAALEKAGGAA